MSEPTGVNVTDAGIGFSSGADEVLDVLFDGRRVWSFWPGRDSRPQADGTRRVGWPGQLRPFLNGTARLTIVEHLSGRTWFDGEVHLGEGDGRIDISDDQGRPLGLDRSNRLSLTFDTRSEEHVAPLLDAMDEVIDALRQCGVDPFLAWGTLLGAVREGRMLGHDHDVDLGYISRQPTPVDAIVESYRVQRALADLGYPGYRYSSLSFQIGVLESDGSRRGLDIFGGFFDGDDLYFMGEVGQRNYGKGAIWPLTTAPIGDREFPVPADPERFVAAQYGPEWRTPDPAFQFDTPKWVSRRLNGWFRGTRYLEWAWQSHWSTTPDQPIAEPSAFARAVRDAEPTLEHLVDVGAGRGSDALWFARQGVDAIALDFAPKAAAAAAAASPDLQVRRVNLLTLRSVLAEAARLSRLDGEVVVMSRWLVNGTNAIGRANLIRLADLATRAGGRLHLEFITGGTPAPTMLKPVAPEQVEDLLRGRGADIVHREAAADGALQVERWVAQWQR